MAAAGSAIVSSRLLPAAFGWIGLGAAVFTIVRIIAVDSPLAALAFVAFFPSLVLSVVFRVWAGTSLLARTNQVDEATAEPSLP